MAISNLSISRRCNDLLIERITHLERNNLNNARYNRRETLEINQCHLILPMMSWNNLLSLTGISVKPDDLQACHRMRKKDWVIMKFKYRKQKHLVPSNRKILQNKSLDLTQLKFWGKLFLNEIMCHKLAYKCRQLKSARKIHSIIHFIIALCM